ncbi:MAG: hypothetical protein ACI3ZQ_07925 [Candidatus Cryptobacteroides sp.]
MRAGTLVEVLVTMILSGLVLLAVYDGLELVNDWLGRVGHSDVCGQLDWLEHYEVLEFRSDSIGQFENGTVFYFCGEAIDTLMNYGF